jgi:predicted homoserine dehydrogenase-like protein
MGFNVDGDGHLDQPPDGALAASQAIGAVAPGGQLCITILTGVEIGSACVAKIYGIGNVGAGVISASYLELAPLFKRLEVRAISDITPAAAEMRAMEFGIKAQSLDEILSNSEIDVILNLTVPSAHYQVSMDALSAGKHVYSEKPLALSLEQANSIKLAA